MQRRVGTPTSTKRPGARDRNRRLILTAARDVLADDRTASMDDIALAAGVVRRTVYGHFASRRELVVGLLHLGVEEFIEQLGEFDVRASHPDVELASVALRAWPAAQRFASVVELAHHETIDAVLPAMMPFHSALVALIEYGQRRGVFARDLHPIVLARVTSGVAQSFLMAHRAKEWDGDVADVVHTQLLMLGLSASAARHAVQQARHPDL